MKRLLLIDANSLIHRSYHALPPFTGPQGQPTGALYGLASILLKILREERLDFIAAFFDRPEQTFRKEIFEEYKIQRPKVPDDLVSQLIESHELFEKLGIKTFESPGFEADDLIGTAVRLFKAEPGLKITILTGDLDTLQLIEGEKIVVQTTKKGVSETITYNESEVKNRYGVLPNQLPDYKGLTGDSSDNIPGVAGIGPKTAAPLIEKYGSLEEVLERGGREKSYKKIFSFENQAVLSKKLATIRQDAPLEIKNLSTLEYKDLNKKNLTAYFEKLGFKTLINRINSS